MGSLQYEQRGGFFGRMKETSRRGDIRKAVEEGVGKGRITPV